MMPCERDHRRRRTSGFGRHRPDVQRELRQVISSKAVLLLPATASFVGSSGDNMASKVFTDEIAPAVRKCAGSGAVSKVLRGLQDIQVKCARFQNVLFRCRKLL